MRGIHPHQSDSPSGRCQAIGYVPCDARQVTRDWPAMQTPGRSLLGTLRWTAATVHAVLASMRLGLALTFCSSCIACGDHGPCTLKACLGSLDMPLIDHDGNPVGARGEAHDIRA